MTTAAPVFCWPVRVYYEDTDAGGVVYHANYLKFCERARTEWLRHIGFEQPHMRAEYGAVFVLHSLSARFVRPALFNDALVVQSRVLAFGRSSLAFTQEIYRGDALLFSAKVRLACVHIERFRPMAIPQVISQKIQELL